MVTPFAEDGSVDEAGARSLARHLVENGSHGVVVAGTTGESPTLSDSEDAALLRAVVDEVGDRATVICGTGTNDTRHSEELSAAAAENGADAILVVTPYYNKPNRAGLLAHYEAVAKAAGIPVIAYNIPSRAVVNVPPELLAELARIENVVAVKQANNDDIGPVEGMVLLAGNDDGFLRCLEAGAAGASWSPPTSSATRCEASTRRCVRATPSALASSTPRCARSTRRWRSTRTRSRSRRPCRCSA